MGVSSWSYVASPGRFDGGWHMQYDRRADVLLGTLAKTQLQRPANLVGVETPGGSLYVLADRYRTWYPFAHLQIWSVRTYERESNTGTADGTVRKETPLGCYVQRLRGGMERVQPS
jgi:hypothetical protein